MAAAQSFVDAWSHGLARILQLIATRSGRSDAGHCQPLISLRLWPGMLAMNNGGRGNLLHDETALSGIAGKLQLRTTIFHPPKPTVLQRDEVAVAVLFFNRTWPILIAEPVSEKLEKCLLTLLGD